MYYTCTLCVTLFTFVQEWKPHACKQADTLTHAHTQTSTLFAMICLSVGLSAGALSAVMFCTQEHPVQAGEKSSVSDCLLGMHLVLVDGKKSSSAVWEMSKETVWRELCVWEMSKETVWGEVCVN